MLKIENLHATVAGRDVLKGITLTINPGEVHAIMGPNGSGKSTLSYVLAGREGYEITKGSVTFMGQDLLAMEPEDRAAEGIFLAFQYPVEIPGVSTTTFLKTALNSVRKKRNLKELEPIEFLKLQKEKLAFRVARRNVMKCCKWPCWSRSWRSSMKRTAALISMR